MNLFEIIHNGILFSGITAAGLSGLLIATQAWHGRYSNDTADGPQKFHTAFTPRIGGIAIFFALVVNCFFSPEPVSQLLRLMLIAGFPAFVAGLTEDITKKVSVLKRLFATMLSGVLAWWLTGYTLTSVEIWGLDQILVYLPLSLAFTAFAVAGVANAVNMIDGFNGLASGTLMICFFALGLVALQVGDRTVAEICFTIIIVLAGFMVYNFPFGKIFMGDGGAYLLGFLLAWVSVMLPLRNPGVSVWAPMVVCAYPINETIITIARRALSRYPLGLPDNRHLHSLIKVKVVRQYFRHLNPSMRNSLVSPFCWSYAAIISATGVALYNQTSILIAAWLGSLLLYILIYATLSRMGAPDEANVATSAE